MFGQCGTYQNQWAKDYGLTRAAYRDIVIVANNFKEDNDNPTQLAEDVAFELGHEEWLDESTHPIWEIVLPYYPI